MLDPRAEDTAFIIPERGAETNWALVSGPYFGPDGKQGINWFYVASGSWLGLRELLLQNSWHKVAVESLAGAEQVRRATMAPGFGAALSRKREV